MYDSHKVWAYTAESTAWNSTHKSLASPEHPHQAPRGPQPASWPCHRKERSFITKKAAIFLQASENKPGSDHTDRKLVQNLSHFSALEYLAKLLPTKTNKLELSRWKNEQSVFQWLQTKYSTLGQWWIYTCNWIIHIFPINCLAAINRFLVLSWEITYAQEPL